MTNESSVRQTTNLFKNYNRLVGITYTLIVIALVLFFGHLLQRKMGEEIELIRGHVARHGQFFEFILRSSSDQLESLRMSASANQFREIVSADDVLFHYPGSFLAKDEISGQFHLDALPDLDAGGNIIGIGHLQNRSQEFYEDLEIVLRINMEWSSLIFTLPHAVKSQFITTHEFKASLPWKPFEKQLFDNQIYQTPVWTMGLPSNNPDRQKYWAPVYFGGDHHGLLAPVAAPIYSNQRFVGVLAIDNSIDYFNRINADFNYFLGLTLLFDRRQQVIAHPIIYANPLEMTNAPNLSSVLPKELSGYIDQIDRFPSGIPQRVNGYLVIRHAFMAAPWSLLYIVEESALWHQLGWEIGLPMIGVLFGLVVLMVFTYLLASREFVGPAAKLINHIALESNFVPTTIPVVPTGWRPWFETITRAFRESMQLVSLRQELDIAAHMQQSILPRHWPDHPQYALWGKMRPAKDIGGDFYDHFEIAENLCGIVVADVSGKGISAGLFGMMSKTLLRSAATQEECKINEMIKKVNDNLATDNDSCMFVTLFYAQLNPTTGHLEFVNAGHPSPLLIHADGTVGYLPTTDGMALGIMDGIEYSTSVVQLLPGDTIVMFTDGVTEAINDQQEEFGLQRLLALFSGIPPTNPERNVEDIFLAVNDFANNLEQFDDITCVALQYRGIQN